ncbi:putative MFS multidrug transporter [Pseudovirgaria hyperparasitica]|uniref:Putative MFS multidrug transporter n=1 Tax=Pseudovirgaria hyperparasitica TaxID=470096 RepID=A0A6A6WHC4_9PEZI|nr:putative MFS multidrug transporter [Pseudovirgaria hyperparasitica]KAF2761484.1 putative MFS multidrug transporter [Pseudovirgaria hyperparasitica]
MKSDSITVTKEPEWAYGFQLLNILAAVTIVSFLMLLDGTIVVAAVPRITDDFNSLKDIGWYGAAYQLGSAVFQPLTGKIYMNFIPKWSFLAFFIIFEIGSLICGVVSTSGMLIGGRVVAGVGTSGMLNGTMLIIAECVPMQKRPSRSPHVPKPFLGLALGPLIGGALTEYSTWRWCFYLNLPLGGLVAAMLVFVRIPMQHPRPPPLSTIRKIHTVLDLTGFAIFAPALVMLLLALQGGGTTWSWNSSQVIGLFCGAGATFIVFLYWNYRKGMTAMLPFSIAGQQTVWTSCLVYGLFMGNLYTASYWVPVYFQGVKGVSPLLSGVYILPMIISHVCAALCSGPIVKIVGYYVPIAMFAAILLTIGSGLMATFSPDTSTGKWIGYQIIYGVGRGLGLQMPLIAVQSTVLPQQLPIAMALVIFSQSFGAAMMLSFAETIYSNSFKTLIAKYAPLVNAWSVIDAGATMFRSIVPGTELRGVLTAYAESIDRVFYLAAGMGVGCFFFAAGMGWKTLKKKATPSKA